MGAKILVLTSLLLTLAVTAAVAAGDEKLEEHAIAIEGKLMAPCCWSSTISQHYSATADEIRLDIRNMLSAGKSEREILDHYVSIYGERILASPSARGFNLLAWLFPGIFFVACAFYVVLLLHRWTLSRSANIAADSPGKPLDDSYMRRLEKELREFE